MRIIGIKQIDKLDEISSELKVLSYLQLLVAADRYALNLDISEEMIDYAKEYLTVQIAEAVNSLNNLINREDFTVSVK